VNHFAFSSGSAISLVYQDSIVELRLSNKYLPSFFYRDYIMFKLPFTWFIEFQFPGPSMTRCFHQPAGVMVEDMLRQAYYQQKK
jgi:hypothetical protein